jgi:hypothetical protein
MKKICSDKTDSIIKSLFGVFLSIGLLIYKIYFADNSKDTAYEYWSLIALFVIILILSLFQPIVFSERNKISKSTNLIEIICIILLIFFPVYNIIRCVDKNQCSFWRTDHYATSSDADYWISISIQLLFIMLLVTIIIFFLKERIDKYNKKKSRDTAKQQRIAKRIQDKEKRRQLKK